MSILELTPVLRDFLWEVESSAGSGQILRRAEARTTPPPQPAQPSATLAPRSPQGTSSWACWGTVYVTVICTLLELCKEVLRRASVSSFEMRTWE